MHRIKDMKKTLISWLEMEISKGPGCFDVEAAGEVTDMIKDLAEAEEKCVKAEYYDTLINEMSENDHPNDLFGYDNWRYSSGRFAPKGRGTYSPEGYTSSSSGGNRSSNRGGSSNRGNSSRNNSRMGYHDPDLDPQLMMPEWSENGMYYDAYQDAKRHYTESNRSDDYAEMNKRLSDNASNVIMQLREMSADASPEVRKKLKTEVSSLMDEINKMM